MPTTRNRWQQEIQPSPEQATADDQANQANPERKRQSSPQRPSVSPAPELAADLQDDPNPRSPKRRRISLDGANESKPDTSQASTTHDPSPSTMDSGQQAVTNSQTPQPLHAKPTVMSSTPTQAPSNGPQPSSAQQTQRPLHQEPLGTTATKIPSMATNTPHPPPRATGPPSQAALQHLPVPQTATSASTLTASPKATGPPAATSLTTPAASKAPALPAPPAAPPPAGAAPMPRGPPAPPTEVIKGRLDNLQKLGDLSEQVLILLSKMPVLDALALDADLRLLSSGQQPSSPAPAEYQRLRALFDPVRNLYVTGFPFLIAEHLAMREPSQTAIIRKANQAMFCSAIFAGGIGQLALDQAFLDIFVPDNGNLFGAQSNIWLELKTQGFMTAMRLKAAPPNQVMSDLFPAGIESRIIARHPASKTLAPSEHEFAARYEGRRKILFDHISRNALPDLDQKFTYVELAKEVANFLIRTYGVGSGPPSLADPIGAAAQGISQSQEGNVPAPAASAAGVSAPQLPASIGSLPSFDATDFIELAARAAAIAMRGTASPVPTPPVAVTRPPPNPQAEAQPQNQVQSGVQPSPNAQNGPPSEPYIPLEPNNSIPHASQSAPTHVLYQRARAAEPMKSSTPGTPRTDADASLRRTWSEEEEKALMDGLDRVQGPHWANIMALHGPGGSLSDALKERNQVQLKDKARNLKLFFLKNKIEVPYYLSQVTGTLETRAPGQADKLDSDPTEHNFKEQGTEEVQDYKAQDVGHDQSEPMEDIKFDNEVKQLHQPNAVMSSIGIDDTKMVVPEAGTEAPNPA